MPTYSAFFGDSCFQNIFILRELWIQRSKREWTVRVYHTDGFMAITVIAIIEEAFIKCQIRLVLLQGLWYKKYYKLIVFILGKFLMYQTALIYKHLKRA